MAEEAGKFMTIGQWTEEEVIFAPRQQRVHSEAGDAVVFINRPAAKITTTPKIFPAEVSGMLRNSRNFGRTFIEVTGATDIKIPGLPGLVGTMVGSAKVAPTTPMPTRAERPSPAKEADEDYDSYPDVTTTAEAFGILVAAGVAESDLQDTIGRNNKQKITKQAGLMQIAFPNY